MDEELVGEDLLDLYEFCFVFFWYKLLEFNEWKMFFMGGSFKKFYCCGML